MIQPLIKTLFGDSDTATDADTVKNFLFHKVVFPIYILYIIFNMTPGVFNDTSSWIRLANPIIRLDGDAITISSLIVNRSFYIVLGVVFLLLSCNVYRQLRTNLKKVISI